MTERQRAALHRLLTGLFEPGAEFRHGDCIGADAEAGEMAFELGWTVIIHPPIDPQYRAFSPYFHEMMPERDYHQRNMDIVNNSDLLVAAPRSLTDQRGGTWWTIRYAQKRGIPIIILYP